MQVSRRHLRVSELLRRNACPSSTRQATRTTTTAFTINTCTSAKPELRAKPVSEKNTAILKTVGLCQLGRFWIRQLFNVLITFCRASIDLSSLRAQNRYLISLSASFINGRCLDHQLVLILVSSSRHSLLYNALYW